MRRAIVLILIFLQFSCAEKLKDSLTLKVNYRPETKYTYSSVQTLQTVIKYTGKPKSLQELKNRGFKNPMISNKKSTIEATISTSKIVDDNKFPVKVEYAMILVNDGQPENPVKATIYGECIHDSIPVFDTVIAEGMEKSYKNALLQSWQKSFSQFSFNGENLKIGEQLSVETTSSIPMEGSEIDMIVKTHYKLISIADEIADFDLTQEYTLNPKLIDNSFKGIVTGKGHLVYDITNGIVLKYLLDTEMQLHKKLDSFDFELITKSGFVQTTKVITK